MDCVEHASVDCRWLCLVGCIVVVLFHFGILRPRQLPCNPFTDGQRRFPRKRVSFWFLAIHPSHRLALQLAVEKTNPHSCPIHPQTAKAHGHASSDKQASLSAHLTCPTLLLFFFFFFSSF
ncbi:hypothetical protein B0I35DRAFT_161614 [Stachybotrys elegans]|uniref:Uncharacterized protein n=1 Tax=Stachybotrys elegans TaxID=80388 RepID=A0A8K0SX65_9HYPO|nr:hypothetical protein B0I35DRAFT_161614 [Stachybotrys elegans]